MVSAQSHSQQPGKTFDPSALLLSQHTFLDHMGLPRNRLKAHRLISEGLSISIVEKAAAYLDTRPVDLAGMAAIDRNTFRRREKSPDSLLSLDQGARMYQLLEVVDAALRLFANNVNAMMQWLHSPALALDDKQPVEMLTTPAGCEAVLTLIGRLEQGVIV